MLAAIPYSVSETKPGTQEVPERGLHEGGSAIDRLVIPRSHVETIGYEGGAEGLLTVAETQDRTLAHVIPPVTLRH